MKYIEALNIYNKGKSQYCHPRKGTAEHAAVLAIQKGNAPPPSAKPPSATGVVMRKSRKTGSAVKMAVPKTKDEPVEGSSGMRMRNTRKKVKVAIPVASFSSRAAALPISQFSSRPLVGSGGVGVSGGGGGSVGIVGQPSLQLGIDGNDGVLGLQARTIIQGAMKASLARKRLKEAEKRMTFDILLNEPYNQPYKFKNVPKSDDFGF
jgi:hypothetical protein